MLYSAPIAISTAPQRSRFRTATPPSTVPMAAIFPSSRGVRRMGRAWNRSTLRRLCIYWKVWMALTTKNTSSSGIRMVAIPVIRFAWMVPANCLSR